MASQVELRLKKKIAEALGYDPTQKEVSELKDSLEKNIALLARELRDSREASQIEVLTESLGPMLSHFQAIEQSEADDEYAKTLAFIEKDKVPFSVGNSFKDFVGSEPEPQIPDQTFTSYDSPAPPKQSEPASFNWTIFTLVTIIVSTIVFLI